MPQPNENKARQKVGKAAENAYYGSAKIAKIQGDAL